MKVENLVVHCRKDKYDVYIGRPSIWGNPFSHLNQTTAEFRVSSREEAIKKYKDFLLYNPELVELAKKKLKGKVLGCWCKPKACHGDILALIANE